MFTVSLSSAGDVRAVSDLFAPPNVGGLRLEGAGASGHDTAANRPAGHASAAGSSHGAGGGDCSATSVLEGLSCSRSRVSFDMVMVKFCHRWRCSPFRTALAAAGCASSALDQEAMLRDRTGSSPALGKTSTG